MIKLYSNTVGQGEVLILLHGNNEDSSYFRYQVEYFSQRYKIITIDTRGHGLSPRGIKPFTIRQFVEDLYDYVTVNKIDKFHLLGFSDGGNIALLFAAKYPHAVDKLIINGANLNTGGVKLRFQIPTTLQYNGYKLYALVNKEAIPNYEMVRLMVKDPNIHVEELKKIKAKTLVIAGSKDDIKESHTQFIAEMIQDSQLRIIPGDHFIAQKNPELFNKVVSKFLENDEVSIS